MMKELKNVGFNELFNGAAYTIGLFGNSGAFKTLEESEYHQAFVVNANSLGYTFGDDDRPMRITKSFFAATAAYLTQLKVQKPDEAVALVLTDTVGNFKFAAIVEYEENVDNPDEPGNWKYINTFNSDTLERIEKKKTVKKLLYGSDAFKAMYDKIAHDIGGVQFEHSTYLYPSCLLVVDTLLQILDREAVDGEVVDIEFAGYFVASVTIEDGEKVFALTPGERVKEIITKGL